MKRKKKKGKEKKEKSEEKEEQPRGGWRRGEEDGREDAGPTTPRAIGQRLKRAGRFRNRLAGFQFHDSVFTGRTRCDAPRRGSKTLQRGYRAGQQRRSSAESGYRHEIYRSSVSTAILREDSPAGINNS